MRNVDKFPSKQSGNEKNFLYTKGKQLSLDGYEYIGEYHITGGKPKTGPIEADDSKLLTLYYSDRQHYVYDKIILGPQKNKSPFVKAFGAPKMIIPNPSTSDYDIGSIERFFVKDQFFSDTHVIEIDRDHYNNIDNESVRGSINGARFANVVIQWKIVGIRDDIFSFNKQQLIKAESILPGIVYAVPNVLQFAQFK